METIANIICEIETFAPINLQVDWDNSGWQIKLENNTVNKIMLALSPTIDVIEQAIEQNCGLLICHHPLIFSGINEINASNLQNKIIIKAIQNNLSIYSAHTNLDRTKNGIGDTLAYLLNLQNIQTFEDFVKIGNLPELMDIDNFINLIKNVLNIKNLRLVNPLNKKTVQKIALCPGSGGSFVNNLKEIDIYLTSDIKYHGAIEVFDFALIDAGHLETEQIILPVLADLLNKFDVETIIAQEKSPFEIV
ncbi:MAG: Nif3-like dinuclear metal center hexameric protein [Candidatus Gastranaerophilales bacterium]|nr:Nif3-like dinuclear metal center hexameric protein [Candidatus Gastranaerophilales bacterium]